MAVAFDSASNGSSSGGGATSLSWSHTASGSDRLVVVTLAVRDAVGFGTFSTATYGGQAMTQVGTYVSEGGAQDIHQAVYYLANPPTGAQTVQFNWSEAGVGPSGCSISFTGAGTVNAETSDAGESPSTTLSPSVPTGGAVVSLLAKRHQGETPSAVGDLTLGSTAGTGGNNDAASGSAYTLTAGTVTCTWTFSSRPWSHVVFSINEAAASDPGNIGPIVRPAILRPQHRRRLSI